MEEGSDSDQVVSAGEEFEEQLREDTESKHNVITKLMVDEIKDMQDKNLFEDILEIKT